jgi:hypothetical protein
MPTYEVTDINKFPTRVEYGGPCLGEFKELMHGHAYVRGLRISWTLRSDGYLCLPTGFTPPDWLRVKLTEQVHELAINVIRDKWSRKLEYERKQSVRGAFACHAGRDVLEERE